jgi:hypothetical protein
MPVILATQEVEIRRVTVQNQPRQIVHETLSLKTHHKKGADRVAQCVDRVQAPVLQNKKKKKKKREEYFKNNQLQWNNFLESSET